MGMLMRRGGAAPPQLQWRPQQFEQGKSLTLPAPYGGLNLRDDITALKLNEARILENWLPTSGQLHIRSGFSSHATGLGSGEVKTLASFVGYTASALLAGANGKIFDVTTAGAATEKATGFANDRWQTALYANRLFFVNGQDTPQVYDGSTVGAIAWSGSGLTNTNLVNVGLVRNRLWFCENNSADVWYGAPGQITAASPLTKFSLSQIAGGGTAMAIASWSRDAGDGADDMTVFVMSTGELIIYEGDPGSTFSLIGKYATSPPIGRQCAFHVGGELIVITRLGFLPVSAAVGGVALDFARIDPWGKIAPGIVEDANLFGTLLGWHGVLHEGVVYVNVPRAAGVLSKQRVLNTRGGQWTDFTAWNGASFASFGNALYFGGSTGGIVYKVTGSTDSGSAIVAIANGSFQYPTAAQLTNIFEAVRPKMQAEGSVTGVIGVDTDFVIRSLTGQSVNIVNDTSQSPWETSPWETSSWGVIGDARPQWYSITGEGKSVSVKLRVSVSSADLRWFATDVLYKPGGIR